MHSPSLLRLFAAALLILTTASCGSGSGDATPAEGKTRDVTTVAIDGFIVLVDHQSVQLFDPSTGKYSQFYMADGPGSEPAKKISISPDGAHIAWINQAGVQISEVVLTDAGPALDTIQQVSNADLGEYPTDWVSWSYDGTRVFYNSGAIDPQSGEVFACDFDGNTSGHSVDPVYPVPGGHAFVCGKGKPQLFVDEDLLAQEASWFLSADGQLAGAGIHIPTGAHLAAAEGAPPDHDNVTPILTGDYARFPSAASGAYVTSDASGNGGWSTVYRIEQAEYVAPVATSYDPTAPQPAPRISWPLEDAILPYFKDGEGRSAYFRALSADGSKAYYSVNSWNIRQPTQIDDVLGITWIESALIEIDRSGESRGFKMAEEFGIKNISANRDARFTGRLGDAVDLGGGDVLLALQGLSPGEVSWAGWLGGKPWAATQIGALATDGRWFAGARPADIDVAPAICLREVKRGANTQCIPRENYATYVQGWAGYGLHAERAGDAPKVLNLSQTAAYDGAQVTIFGVRFGSSGTLKVGDVTMPASAIVSWKDRRIIFKMDAALPEAGAVVVEAATGSSAGGRHYWLHHTHHITTPFDNLVKEEITLGQGLNVVDLGDLTISSTRDILFSPDTRLADGRYVVFSDGGPQDPKTRRSVKLDIDGYSNTLNFRTEDRLADPAKWQLINRVQLPGGDPGSAFVHIAGALANPLYSGQFPQSNPGGRVLLLSPASPIPHTMSHNWGLPKFWRERPEDDSAWVTVKENNYSAKLLLQTGWNFEPTQGPIPTHAEQPQMMMNYLQGVEGAGDTVLATGYDPMGEGGAAYALSGDGGLSFGPHTLIADALGRTDTHLREPIRVEAATGTFFLVLESPWNGPGLNGIHAINLDGTFLPNIAELPPGTLDGGLASSKINLQYGVKGGEVLLYFPATKTLARADFDAAAPGGGQYAWQTLPTPEDAGHVSSFYKQPGTDEIIVVLDDGKVMRAESDWTAWTPQTFDFDLALETDAQPTAVARLPDGRWLVTAKLFDAADGAPSPFGTGGMLVSPAP